MAEVHRKLYKVGIIIYNAPETHSSFLKLIRVLKLLLFAYLILFTSFVPWYVCICQPQLQCGERSSIGAVRLAGRRALFRYTTLAGAFLPSLRSVLVLVLFFHSILLLRPPLVFSQEDVKMFPSARDSPPVG